ncbi:MAG TPA: glycosyltransferase family 9 protein [Gemmatimonadales bacterium]|nr:glycosyltransferase family 9 protein [Gemmatimonadales bacterium]
MNPLKPAERFLRRRFLALTDRPFAGDLVNEPRDALALGPSPRMLLLRPDRIGDVLVSTPVIRTLRQQFPQAQIDILLSRTNYGVQPALARYIDHAWRYDKSFVGGLRLARSVRRQRYDVVIDLIDNPSTSAQLIAMLSRARFRVGIRHERSAHYTHAVPLLDRQTVHIVERIAQLLLPFGIDPRRIPLDLEYPLSDTDRSQARSRIGPGRGQPLLIVNISGGGKGLSPARYWGRDNFVEFLRWVRGREPRFEILIGGAPDDMAEVQSIANATEAGVIPASPSFHEFAAMVHEADVLLTPDTSVLHLGAAWKIPTIALFHAPSGAPLPWYPYRSPYRALLHADGVARIPVAPVQEAFTSLLAERLPSTAPAPER